MKQYFTKEYLRTHKEFVWKAAAIAVMIAAAFVVFVLNSSGEPVEPLTAETKADTAQMEQTMTEQTPQASETQQTEEAVTIFVDISGAVQKPMVAELPQGSRVADAIRAAGGLQSDADIESINRAAFLTDGEKIIIPTEGELEQLPPDIYGAAQTNGGMGSMTGSGGSGGTADGIDLNTATSEELQTLNGVGPVTADKIIAYREENGRFTDPEQLKEIDGIGDKTYEKLKDDIRV